MVEINFLKADKWLIKMDEWQKNWLINREFYL